MQNLFIFFTYMLEGFAELLVSIVDKHIIKSPNHISYKSKLMHF